MTDMSGNVMLIWTFLPWSITLFKRRSFIYVFRQKRLTLTVHASLKHHNENGSVLQHLSKDESKCHSKPHTSIKRLRVDLSKPILTTESLAAQLFMLW